MRDPDTDRGGQSVDIGGGHRHFQLFAVRSLGLAPELSPPGLQRFGVRPFFHQPASQTLRDLLPELGIQNPFDRVGQSYHIDAHSRHSHIDCAIGNSGRYSGGENIPPGDRHCPLGLILKRDFPHLKGIRNDFQHTALADQPAFAETLDHGVDRADTWIGAERESQIDARGDGQFLLKHRRQTVGWHVGSGTWQNEDVLLPRLFIQRMAFPEDVDLARNVEVVDLLRKTCSRQRLRRGGKRPRTVE